MFTKKLIKCDINKKVREQMPGSSDYVDHMLTGGDVTFHIQLFKFS